VDRRITEVTGLSSLPLAEDGRGQRVLALRLLDSSPVACLTALALGTHAAGTSTGPRTFICDDREEYWVKRRAQSGLLAELAAGRLAEKLGAGPHVSAVRVPWEALPRDRSLSEFDGIWVGIQHVPAGISARDIGLLLGTKRLDHSLLDEDSRALAIALQTWLNDEDPQVLIDMDSGHVLSIDHGQCFKELLKGPPTRIVITPIPGIPDNYGFRAEPMDRALARIEALSEQDILAAVSRVPDGDGWLSLFDRRLAIANWLIKRQSVLREVMRQWSYRVS
jgi:hypothetical protein